MSAEEQDDESPLSGRLAESSKNGPVGGAPADQEDDEDAAPDWLAFAAFAKSLSAKHKGGTASINTDAPVIPKRGEKDFEPAQQTNHKTYQDNLLENSRAALFNAIHSSSTGGRTHSSKAHNRAVWDDRIERAYMVDVKDPALPLGLGRNAPTPSPSQDGQPSEQKKAVQQAVVHGIHFQTMGKYSSENKRIELLPEEALYLLERGTIECWTTPGRTPPDYNEESVPMTLQHAWSLMIHSAGLTPERYQIYAYLKRLGYTVIRAQTSSPLSSWSALQRRAQDPQSKTAVLVKAISYLTRAFLAPLHILSDLTHRLFIGPTFLAMERLRLVSQGYAKSLVGGQRWFTYDQIFTSLQFTSRKKTAATRIENAQGKARLSNRRFNNPYSVLYDIYKPVTKFKKTDPPPPDFRIAIIDAQKTPIPDLYDFANIFGALPEEGSPTFLTDTRPGTSKDGNTILQAFLSSSFVKPVKSLLAFVSGRSGPAAYPTSVTKGSGKTPTKKPSPKQNHSKPKAISLTRPSPFAKLKAGKKAAIIAVVDNSTISFQKFGMTDFTELPWVGDGGSESWERDLGTSLA